MKELSAQISSKQLKLKVELQPCEINADPTKLLRAVINLLSNSVKYSPAGSELLVLASVKSGILEFKVKDKGPGVAAENLNLIFERYGRVQSKENQQIEGTGLGLPIAKSVIESHGGIIGVESEQGKGSTFWFNLPIGRQLRT